MPVIAQGAEAIITREGAAVTKERIAKGYRINEIDEPLRKKRTRLEARLMREARRAGVAVPQVLDEQKFAIKMEFVDGKRVKEAVDADNFHGIAKKMGEAAGKLHTYDIIHGDLTTSNMILKDDVIYLIDFGLGFISKRPEDKATDLHVLREAITATHFAFADRFWKAVVHAYEAHYGDSGKVIKALHRIEKRGRYVRRTD